VENDQSRSSSGGLVGLIGTSFVAAALGLALVGAPVVYATDTFIGPSYPDPDCDVAFTIGGTPTQMALPPDMIAEVVGIPVGVTGTPAPQTLVVVELGASVDQNVVRTFLSLCGMNPVTWTDFRPTGETASLPVSGEATLDLTVVAGIMPANTTLKTATVESGANFAWALLNAAHACGLDGDDPSTWTRSQLDTPQAGCIVTMSYAVFEKSLRQYLSTDLGIGTTADQDVYVADTDEILAGMANAGVIAIVSSGDEGSGGCEPYSRGQQDQMAPQWPSTSPNVLSIGGTMWAPPNWNGAAITATDYVPGATYQPVSWRNWDLGSDCYWDAGAAVRWPGIGTTGGESSVYARPGYQQGVASALPSSTGRLSPDISALAGWPTWLVPQNNDGTAFTLTLGTSAAAPLTAVGLAHVNAALTARGLSPIDNSGGSFDVHSIIYSSAFSSAFNDVSEGTNNLWSSDLWTGSTAVTTTTFLTNLGFLSGGVPTANGTISGYSASAGFDVVTGMGVPNFSTLARLLIDAQTITYDPQGPPPVLQQVPMPESGSCLNVDDARYNWGGADSGGWGQSWAQWANAGAGGPICTRTLIYNSGFGIWVVER